jgi:hypothetical protein
MMGSHPVRAPVPNYTRTSNNVCTDDTNTAHEKTRSNLNQVPVLVGLVNHLSHCAGWREVPGGRCPPSSHLKPFNSLGLVLPGTRSAPRFASRIHPPLRLRGLVKLHSPASGALVKLDTASSRLRAAETSLALPLRGYSRLC